MDGVSVSDERLLEIASAINKLDGALVVFGYLLSLGYNDMDLFLNCVNCSLYKDLDLYEAIKRFSQDCVMNIKNVVVDDSSFIEFCYEGKSKLK